MGTRTGEADAGLFHILATTDFSPASELALKVASEEVRVRGLDNCRVTLLTVVENPFSQSFNLNLGSDRESVWIESETEAKRNLEHLNERYFGSPLVQTIALRQTGQVADDISRYCRLHVIDMIVITTHGRSGLVRNVFGSVTEEIIRHSRCPILVVPMQGYTKE